MLGAKPVKDLYMNGLKWMMVVSVMVLFLSIGLWFYLSHRLTEESLAHSNSQVETPPSPKIQSIEPKVVQPERKWEEMPRPPSPNDLHGWTDPGQSGASGGEPDGKDRRNPCPILQGGDCDELGIANHPGGYEWKDDYDNDCNGDIR